MAEDHLSTESGAVVIERINRYTIAVDGYTVRANGQQERAIRNMTARQRADFLRIMGVSTPPASENANRTEQKAASRVVDF